MAKNKDNKKISEISIPEGYLTLKEAADLTNYTPDYIGQLIRAGKIEGRQVVSSVAWVTSESSLRTYLSKKGKEVPTELLEVRELPDLARPLLYLVIGSTVALLIVLLHIFSISIDRAISASVVESRIESERIDI